MAFIRSAIFDSQFWEYKIVLLRSLKLSFIIVNFHIYYGGWIKKHCCITSRNTTRIKVFHSNSKKTFNRYLHAKNIKKIKLIQLACRSCQGKRN